MFEKLREKLGGILGKTAEGEDEGGFWKISGSKLDEILWELEVALMEADVAVDVISEIKGEVRKELAEKKVKWGQAESAVREALRSSISKVLTASAFDFDGAVKATEKPLAVMFVGVNGTGKTTAIAKIAHRLLKQNVSVVLAAGDTFRAGAIEQISLHADKLGVKVIKHEAGGDPSAVAYDAIEHAKARKRDVVLIDTAGRMQTNKNLMDEMRKLKRVAEPGLIIFVGDSLAGNDAVEQAKAFEEAVGIDAVILTKIDADAKGGAALSIAKIVKKPIAFVSTGQEYEQLEKFDAEWMTKRIFP